MSISSLGNQVYGLAPYAVLQQGQYTKVANVALDVPCVGIKNTDFVINGLLDKTAGTSYGEEIVINSNLSKFTSTSIDATFAGNVSYSVVRSSATVRNVP
jgi:hypothetical protein